MIRQFELVERVRQYDPGADEDALNRAYVFSMKAHGSQKRASGDPYFSHPLEVAGILTDLKLDGETIVTALLHDTVEDTVATLDEITDMFGPSIGPWCRHFSPTHLPRPSTPAMCACGSVLNRTAPGRTRMGSGIPMVR